MHLALYLARRLWVLALVLWCARAWCAEPMAAEVEPQVAQQVALGKRIFFDKRLSASGRIACASCHLPDKQFADGLPLAVGHKGLVGTRNTPSLLDVARQQTLFWDGRRTTLEEQALDPMVNPLEHALPSDAALLRLLRGDAQYVRGFRQAFGLPASQITVKEVARALAAYQRTLVSGTSAFDRFLAGDEAALDAAARRGWGLFSGAAQCVRCHTVQGERPLFTDHGFHSLSVGLSQVERKLPALTQQLVALQQAHRVDGAVLSDADMAELGRFVMTLDPADLGKFKTPSLRNVSLTAPYMHNGSVPTLEAAVDLELYYRGAQGGRPLILTPQERADVVAFLRALQGQPYNSRPQ